MTRNEWMMLRSEAPGTRVSTSRVAGNIQNEIQDLAALTLAAVPASPHLLQT